ncbi:MAG: bifunctional methionine sulfoxide reductase B/A protein [Bacteroidetes bacterium]|nr:bifunctional methionine sulfoxide reductase B/A protein [Bacteroidota bacterium]
MKRLNLLLIIIISNCFIMAQSGKKELTAKEKYVIIDKGTEAPFSGKYLDFSEKGSYVCKQCGSHLYKSSDKFSSNCGWPSFDDEIKGAIKHIPDADGQRTEIVCANCNAHLGHVFLNEGFTQKNTRHCVNSISLNFITAKKNREAAIFAGGCFWGVEYYMEKQKGVISVESGYIGGKIKNPSYETVCSGTSGHAEAVKIIFDPSVTNFETLAKIFFEIHDPTQLNRQGPDFGKQYRSEIFYTNPRQKIITDNLIKILQQKGFNIATKVTAATEFYKAENYHQDYYKNKGTLPYCHKYTKRF